jgi:transcription initiation factor TFIIF subunit beta
MFVDSRNRKNSLVVVKLPMFLAERLEKTIPGCTVGILDTGDSSKWIPEEGTSFTLDPSLSGQDFPCSYRVDAHEKSNSMCFTESPRGILLEGTVAKEAQMRPVISAGYLRFKRERESSLRAPRMVKAIDSQSEGRRIERQGGATEYDLLARKRKKILMERKRERLAKTEVMEILFKAFDEQSNWALKDLADRSGQPQAYIQEILPEIAVMNKKTHRNTYELKPEYRYGSNRE